MAGPQIVVEMSADEAKMWQAMKKLEKAEGDVASAMKRIGSAAREVSAEHRKLERDAKRVYESTRNPQERYNQQLQNLKVLYQQNKIGVDTYRRAVDQLNNEYRESSLLSGRAFGGAILDNARQLAGLFGIGGGVAGAIMAASKATAVWTQNMREISTEAKKAANEMIALAALQEGGEKGKRVLAADALATRYGIDDRGEAFNTVQALQSAYGGDFQKGMEAAATVFAGTQLGIPIESGRELEVLGASQGQSPGDAIRRAYVAGQASSRDPKTISKSASGISFWDDPEVGFAAAGVLSAGVKEDELQTYLTRGGIALSSVGNLKDWINEQELETATQLERLKRLSELGMDTPEELAGLGVDEVREQKSLAVLVKNYSEVERILGEIRSRAKPGLLAGQRTAVEDELPNAAISRQIDILRSEFKSEQAFGETTGDALEKELTDRVRGLLYQKAGYTELLGFDLIDEEGRSAWYDRELAKFIDDFTRDPLDPNRGPSVTQLEAEIPKVIDFYKLKPGEELKNLDSYPLPETWKYFPDPMEAPVEPKQPKREAKVLPPSGWGSLFKLARPTRREQADTNVPLADRLPLPPVEHPPGLKIPSEAEYRAAEAKIRGEAPPISSEAQRQVDQLDTMTPITPAADRVPPRTRQMQETAVPVIDRVPPPGPSLSEPAAPSISPEAKWQVDQLEAGRTAVTPIVPTPGRGPETPVPLADRMPMPGPAFSSPAAPPLSATSAGAQAVTVQMPPAARDAIADTRANEQLQVLKEIRDRISSPGPAANSRVRPIAPPFEEDR